jgi:penicillin-binding protein 1C
MWLFILESATLMLGFISKHLRVILLALIGVIGVSWALFYAWILADLPAINTIQSGIVLPSTRIFDRNGQLLYEISAPETGRNTAISLSEIPQNCIHAVIATEDENYWSHVGVDAIGIARALWINLSGGETIAGGSTITQQTARLLLLDPQGQNERTLERKLKEMVLAIRLQNATNKETVLTLYLNQVYFGNLAYGIEAAANAYFQKSASQLSLAECSLLAGMVQNATLYDPLANFDGAKERQRVVLDLMVSSGYITEIQANSAYNDQLQFASTPFPIQAPHFVMAVLKQLERQYPYELYNGGLNVTTTLDLNWQNIAQRVAQEQLYLLNNPTQSDRVPANANNAALVAIDPFTGEILTMLGSPDYFDTTIDGTVNATLAYRQPGSALKPFTYALAMQPTQSNPYTPATVLMDVETPFVTRRLESYVPANYAFVEHGPVSIRTALANSYNIPAVVALQHVGMADFVSFVGNAGLANLANNQAVDLSITLGGGEVRLLDLAQAYSIFPNGGYRIEPQYILHVETTDGQVLFDYTPPPLTLQVLDERVAYLITDILSDDEARIPAFGRINSLQIGRPAAAKTGTTTDFRDNWVMGYTPSLVVGVWVGNADNTPMTDITGVSGAGPIYNLFMREVLNNTPEESFSRPEGLVEAQVCILSGLLPTPYCEQTRTELFIDGTVPTQRDNYYQMFQIDRATGQLANAQTPLQNIVERVFIVLPQEAQDWGRTHGIPTPPLGANVNSTDSTQTLRLLEPDPYTIFEISTVIPLNSQRLRFHVAIPPNAQTVTYLLNGQSIGTRSADNNELWWQLQVGEYELVAQATLEDGSVQTSSIVPFTVVNSGQQPTPRSP